MTSGQPGSRAPALFNSDVETGIRALVVLDALYPRACNESELTWFDYAVVNTGQFEDAPTSLHPASEVVTGELLVRRHAIQRGVRLLQLMHLADERRDEGGFTYSAGEEAPAFLDRLSASYHRDLKERARWLADRFGSKSEAEIAASVESTIGRWTAELQSKATPAGSSP